MSSVVIACIIIYSACAIVGCIIGWVIGNKLYPKGKIVDVDTKIVFDSDKEKDIPSDKYIEYSDKNSM